MNLIKVNYSFKTNGVYYGLNVCDLPKFRWWNPTSNVTELRGLWAILLILLVPFKKRSQGACLLLQPHVDIWEGTFMRQKSTTTLSWNSQHSKLWEINFHCLWTMHSKIFCYSRPNRWRILNDYLTFKRKNT